jgi:glycosyltransferase involved in cell wall biosynthesis
VYAPYDEDFGYVTLEAFLARRPVITATDSGGPLEFVRDGVNGAIVHDASPEAIAAAVNAYAADRPRARAHGEAGHQVASAITWSGVIERIIEAASADPA